MCTFSIDFFFVSVLVIGRGVYGDWEVMTGMFLGRKRHRTLAERERKK
jgi:hypothetical protein